MSLHQRWSNLSARRSAARGLSRWPWSPLLLAVLLVAPAPFFGRASAADSTQTLFSSTVTIPVPPATNYAGSGGGDGWAVALTPTAVYNVFHHQATLEVACHLQSDASPCWDPKTITDAVGNDFAVSGEPGLTLDQPSGHLFVYATRSSDGTGGVVCIDTTQPAANLNPFCGFTALTAVGDAPTQGGLSGISDGLVVGGRFYGFNYVDGSKVAGTQNAVLCFDIATAAPCAGQPYALPFGGGTVSASANPVPAVAAIGNQVFVPVTTETGDVLACFDATTSANCSGAWPAAITSGFAGAPFPLMTAAGATSGVCVPVDPDPCFSLAGASVATPAALAGVIGQTEAYNGPAFVLGPRVYVPSFDTSEVACFDYSTGASCANFPKELPGLDLLYTVNADPQRPTCIWVNSDNGSAQIQNFDAFTGGPCGAGDIRVLAATVVVPTPLCAPSSWNSLEVQAPAPGTYASGSVAFQDADANPIPGAASKSLDGTGKADLTGLNLSTASGLPQFVITLTGQTGNPASVVVKLTWTSTNDPSCSKPGTGPVQNNSAPVAAPQSLSTMQDTALPVTLSATDADNDPLTYSVVAPPTHGTLSGTAPNLTYTPTGGYIGPDSFTFKANDGHSGDSNVATVSITVTQTPVTNHAPVADNQSLATPQDVPIPVTLTASDADNDPLTYSVVAPPTHGTLSGTAPNLTYTPTGGYVGPDSFTFKANDGKDDSNTATVAINVTSAPVGPAATQLMTSLSGGKGDDGGHHHRRHHWNMPHDGQDNGGAVSVPAGTAVTDSATLTGDNASTAIGTVTYTVYSENTCTTAVSSVPAIVTTPGTMPDSAPVALTDPGTYYWQAHYSGDANNQASTSACGSEVETVTAPSPEPTSVTTSLAGGVVSGHDWWPFHPRDVVTVFQGSSVFDTATLAGANAASATGTVTFTVFSDPSGRNVVATDTEPVVNGAVTESSAVTLDPGVYYWQASYSGDALNAPSVSDFGSEIEIVVPSRLPHPPPERCGHFRRW